MTDEIPDSKDNVVVVPEIYTEYVLRFVKAKTVVWWMSVDNYKQLVTFSIATKKYGICSAIKSVLCGRFRRKRKGVYKASVHLYQCEYIRLFLDSCKIKRYYPLSDYINDVYFQNDSNDTKNIRSNKVLYNPKKGWEFTRKIIESRPDIEFTPLENLTTEQIAELLRTSKVYIDFGNHPGKDRFPREAAISGCCIIAGKRGAAGNDIDINIPDEFKFEDRLSNVPAIGQQIDKCLRNYEIESAKFEEYREKIRHEKESFVQQTEEFCRMTKNL